jgi:dolichol-phosphate mannosyltransferase
MPTSDHLVSALLVVPTFNEVEGIDLLLDLALAADPNLEVLVVDDGSPDGTGELVAKRASVEPRLHLLSRPSKLGLGSAYVAGFRHGLSHGYQLFIEMDADLSHDPADLTRLIEASRYASLTIGSRYVEGGAVQGWSSARHLLSRCANSYARAMLGFPIRDSTSGFRCYRREVLEAVVLESVVSEGYAFQIDLAYRAWKLGFEVREIPITFKERRAGRSKMSGGIILEGVVRVTAWGLENMVRRLRGRLERMTGEGA